MDVNEKRTVRARGLEVEIVIAESKLREVRLPRKVPSQLDSRALLEMTTALAAHPISFNGATDFQQKVWKRMMKIPRGKTLTYSELAASIGRPKAARAVGSAVGSNKHLLVVPCHRVVAKSGLGGFRCGLAWKKKLLDLEAA